MDAVRVAPVAEKEIIVVDDFSGDGTRDILRNEIAPLVSQIIYHPVNCDKGVALFTTAPLNVDRIEKRTNLSTNNTRLRATPKKTNGAPSA